jgi:hypothetical protein
VFLELNSPDFNINNANCVSCTVSFLIKIKLHELIEDLDIVESYGCNPQNCLICKKDEICYDLEYVDFKKIIDERKEVVAVFKYRMFTSKILDVANYKFDVSQLVPMNDRPHFKNMLIYQDNIVYLVPEHLIDATWRTFITRFPHLSR